MNFINPKPKVPFMNLKPNVPFMNIKLKPNFNKIINQHYYKLN